MRVVSIVETGCALCEEQTEFEVTNDDLNTSLPLRYKQRKDDISKRKVKKKRYFHFYEVRARNMAQPERPETQLTT
jgi:hypothetical protein